MISRTQSKTEENYATYERELIAIVWFFQKLRNYLYGTNQLNIFTNHQPLIFAIFDKNPNSKIKRWIAIMEEFSPTFFTNQGKKTMLRMPLLGSI